MPISAGLSRMYEEAGERRDFLPDRIAFFVECGCEVFVEHGIGSGRALTRNDAFMRERLRLTDVLVDATQRGDPTTPISPNEWVAEPPERAVICDLVVDPYILIVSNRLPVAVHVERGEAGCGVRAWTSRSARP